RALTDDELLAQVALPVVGDRVGGDVDSVGTALEDLGRRSAHEWGGPAAPPIRLLPEVLDPDELPDPLDAPELVPLGLPPDTMGPALLDLAGRDQHLLVLGDARCGKTTLLRGVVEIGRASCRGRGE